MKPFPLTPSTGTLPDDKIIGRDKEIINILTQLRVQSVTVEEIRRMGKTLLLKKLVRLCNNNMLPEGFADDNFKAIYFSFQGKKNLGEVIDLIISEIKNFKKWYQIDFNKTYDFIRSITGSVKANVAGAEISVNLPEFKSSWKQIFFKTLEEVAENLQENNQKLILIFDELPIMLWDWYKAGQYQEAIELLDILRERRQELEIKGLRFIYCGSIGIKVILQTLKQKHGYTGEPTNDMFEFNLNPFSLEESKLLMECYVLSGYKIEQSQESVLFEVIFEKCCGLPFYMAHIFIIIQNEFGGQITIETINESYNLILNDPKYQRAFKQLKERLETYYTENSKLMSKILSLLAKNDDEIEEPAILHQLEEDNEKIKDILYTLTEDHYLLRTTEYGLRKYTFKYQIFKKWWRINIA